MTDKPGRRQLSGYVMRDYDHLIATLCASRDSQQLTNADVGRRIPIDRASVSRWLTGRSTPYGTRLVELIYALGYDLALVPREDAGEDAPSARLSASVAAWHGSVVARDGVELPWASQGSWTVAADALREEA